MTITQDHRAKERWRIGLDAARANRRRTGRPHTGHPAIGRASYSAAEVAFLRAVEATQGPGGKLRPEWPHVSLVLGGRGDAGREEYEGALSAWRASTGRRFAAWTDIFRILSGLGFVPTDGTQHGRAPR